MLKEVSTVSLHAAAAGVRVTLAAECQHLLLLPWPLLLVECCRA
jgi:hypothetical protein